MAVLERSRRLINGVWKYVSADESGGGGSQPKIETLTGAAQQIANGDGANLALDQSVGPDTLLDLTDPANPTFLEAGTYAVNVQVTLDAGLTAGGSYFANASLAGGQVVYAAEILRSAANASPACTATLVGVAAAGDTVTMFVLNEDGTATRGFSYELVICKIA